MKTRTKLGDTKKACAVKIGLRIKAEREAKGWTLEDLSSATNGVLSKSRIGNYEQGTREPRTREAKLLASALSCSAAYLMLVGDDMTTQEQELLRNFRALPEKDRNDYARRIQAIATIYREPVADERLAQFQSPRPKNKAAQKLA